DPRRARDPARPLGARAQHRPRSPGSPRHRAGGRLHDGPEAPADHGGQGAGDPGRNGAGPRLRRAISGSADAAPARARPRGPRLRWIGGPARGPGPLRPAGVARGNRTHSEAPGRDRGREAMTTLDTTSVEALGWALVHFAWQGTLAAGLFAVVSLAAHGAGARVRYALAAFTLAAMALMPPLTLLAARASKAEVVPAITTAPANVGAVRTASEPASGVAAWPAASLRARIANALP